MRRALLSFLFLATVFVGVVLAAGEVLSRPALRAICDSRRRVSVPTRSGNAVRFGPVDAPVNALGLRRTMFAVDDIDAVIARMQAHGAELIGQMQYEKSYRLAYICGLEGLIVGLAEQLGGSLARTTIR